VQLTRQASAPLTMPPRQTPATFGQPGHQVREFDQMHSLAVTSKGDIKRLRLRPSEGFRCSDKSAVRIRQVGIREPLEGPALDYLVSDTWIKLKEKLL